MADFLSRKVASYRWRKVIYAVFKSRLRSKFEVSMGLRRTAARGVLIVAVLKVLGTVTGRVSQVVLPLYLLPSDFGLFALAAFFSGLMNLAGDLGLSTELVRRKARFQEAADTAFVLRLAVAFGLVALSVVVGWAASIVYSEPRLSLPIVVLSLGLLLQAISMVPRIVATRDLDFARAAIPDSAGKFSGAFLTIGLAVIGLAYWSPVYGTVVAFGVGALSQLAFSKWRPRFQYRSELARELLRFGQLVNLAAFGNFVAHSIDQAIVGFILGVSLLGYYVVAYSWGVYFTSNLASILSAVSYPVFSQVADSLARVKRVFIENLRYYTYLSVCLSVGVLVLAPVFVLAIYGETWRPAIVPMQILAPVGLLLGYSAIAANGLYAVGKPRIVFAVSWLEAALLVILLPPVTILAGLPGTSLAAVVGAIAAAVGTCLPASRIIGLSTNDWWQVGRLSILAGLLAATPTWLATIVLQPSMITLALMLTEYLVMYVAVLQVATRGRFLSEIRGLFRLALA